MEVSNLARARRRIHFALSESVLDVHLINIECLLFSSVSVVDVGGWWEFIKVGCRKL